MTVGKKIVNSLLDYDELINGVNGNVLPEKNSSEGVGGKKLCCFTSVQTDSRNVVPGSMFVPLMGEFQNGHKFIPSAIEKGASVILIEKHEYENNKNYYDDLASTNFKILFVVVENTLQGLQNAAETYISKVCKNMIRVSITGSSGKTTTKEMMVSVAKAHFGDNGVAYTKGNFNSETGLPLTAFTIRGDEKIAILEMGMNRVNEIGEISKVFKSQYGIITNIGTAHIGILGSRENIAREKRKSLDYIPENGAAVIWSEDDFGDFCCENLKGHVVKFGANIEEKVSGVKFIQDKGLLGSVFSVDGETVNLPLPGKYNYLNALSVVALGRKLGISSAEIKKGLESVNALSGRMEIKEMNLSAGRRISVIKDCYNANLESMSKVLDFTGELKNIGKKIFVLGDMKELGTESEKSHKAIGEKINKIKPDFTFFVGSEMKAAYEVIENKKNVFLFNESSDGNFAEIIKEIGRVVENNDMILIKGSHSMELEKLVPMIGEI